MVHVLNNFPEKYDVILDGLEHCLMATVDDALVIEVIREKLNHLHKKTKAKKEKKVEKKRPLEPMTNSISRGVISVGSMAINLAIGYVLKMKMKKTKKIKKQNRMKIKIKKWYATIVTEKSV